MAVAENSNRYSVFGPISEPGGGYLEASADAVIDVLR